MSEIFLVGFGLGFVLSFTFGTVFFALIQNSIDFGWKKGLAMAWGVVLGDALLLGSALFGTGYLPQIPDFSTYLRYGGGGIILLLGMVALFQKTSKPKYPKTKIGGWLYFFSSGFFLNSINPINFFSWVAICTTFRQQYPASGSGANSWLFLLSCLVGIFVSEALIAVLAHRLKRFLSEQHLFWLKKITGIVFVIVGFRILLY